MSIPRHAVEQAWVDAHIGTRAKGKTRLLAREFGEPVGAVFFVRPRTGAPPPDLED